MLQETDQILNSLKEKSKLVALKRAQKRAKLALIKKYTEWFIIFGLICCVFLFPIETATWIGTWIRQFFGTIYLVVFQ